MSEQKRDDAGNEVEKTVRRFYDEFGWVEKEGKSGEDLSFRQFRPPYYPYYERVTQRTVRCVNGITGRLLIAGGGDIPDSHLQIARRFPDVCCVDLSAKALSIAKRKLQNRPRCILASIVKLPCQPDSFDAVFCAHVIYHIDRDYQEQAIRELIRATKPGGRLVFIYSNPDSAPNKMVRIKGMIARRFRRTQAAVTGSGPEFSPERPNLPFALHPLTWWNRFEPQCQVAILPWQVMSNNQEKELVHTDFEAKLIYGLCSWVEHRFPNLAARWWQYPIVILTKKPLE